MIRMSRSRTRHERERGSHRDRDADLQSGRHEEVLLLQTKLLALENLSLAISTVLGRAGRAGQGRAGQEGSCDLL